MKWRTFETLWGYQVVVNMNRVVALEYRTGTDYEASHMTIVMNVPDKEYNVRSDRELFDELVKELNGRGKNGPNDRS